MGGASLVERRRGLLFTLAVWAWSAAFAAAAPPTITITSPAGPFTTHSEFIALAGTASDDTGIQSVTWTSSNAGSGTATGTTSWSIPTIVLSEGENTIVVTATDLDGMTATDSVVVTFHELVPIPPPPVLIVLVPLPPRIVTKSTTEIGGQIIAQAGVVSTTWVNDRGGSGTLILQSFSNGTGFWSTGPVALALGDNVFTIQATDNMDRTGTVTVTVTYNLPVPLQYYFAEGATGGFFDTELLLANPHFVAAPVSIRYTHEDGQIVEQTLSLPPMSRTTVRVNEVLDLHPGGVSSVVSSTEGLPLAVERTMRWDSRGYGGHTEKASDGPATTWYFAEGSQGFFSTFLLLSNPNDAANVATVEYLLENAPSVVREYQMTPRSRRTVDLGQDAALVNTSFGMIVTFAQAGMAERSMYFGADPLWAGGHASAGVTAPATEWLLAEGATGPFFETFILMANPGDEAATVDVTFLRADGPPIARSVVVPARGRVTINPEVEDPLLANAAIATRLVSTHPIVAERAQYWPGSPDQWTEAHNSFGVTAPGTRWALAEGRVGGPEDYQTYVLVAIPGTVTAEVTVTFLRVNQPPIVTVLHNLSPSARVNVVPGPELANEAFGVRVESSVPIVVERAMYWNALGQVWGAGTNATATRLPVP